MRDGSSKNILRETLELVLDNVFSVSTPGVTPQAKIYDDSISVTTCASGKSYLLHPSIFITLVVA